MLKMPVPAVWFIAGLDCSVIAAPLLFVTVIVPLCVVSVPLDSDGLGAEKLTVVPVPVRDTLPATLPDTLTLRVAGFEPVEVGLKATPMVQLVPGVRAFGYVVPQSVAPVVVRVYWPALPPANAMLLMDSVAVAVLGLATVTLCAALVVPTSSLPKGKDAGVTVKPAPIRPTGELVTGTFAVIVTVPFTVPGDVGWNVIVIVQLVLVAGGTGAASVVPQEPPDRANGAVTAAAMLLAPDEPLLVSVRV